MHMMLIPQIGYLLCMLGLTIFGLHRYWQVFLFYRGQVQERPSPRRFEYLPYITVQLPMYNERYVAERVIRAACQINYPRHLLEIQVLDDSTDESADICRSICESLVAEGYQVKYMHRKVRTGFKAGALAEGLKSARGEFIAIFDADFIPQPNMLRDVIHHFTDPDVGCVQTRWGHLNRRHSLLTRCQAIFLDGHFVIEHTARNRTGRFMNFNGTGGVWRKSAIEDGGGWQHDTLTEDMDLSYRAQAAGWKMVFLPNVVSPAELPPEIVSFKQQQHRWTKGSVQTARKVLPGILKSKLPMRVKVESVFHLASGVVYPLAVLLSILIFPAFLLTSRNLLNVHSILGQCLLMGLFGLLTFSAGTFYVVAQKEMGENLLVGILMVPLLMAVGMGISLANAVAVFEGLFGHSSEFIRTPKYGVCGGESGQAWKKRVTSFKHRTTWLPAAELALGLYLLACIAAALYLNRDVSCVPFMFIFMTGYLYVGGSSVHALWLSRRHAQESATQHDADLAVV
jgi:cellulose synthase/poly-beta-1,6-N-acetylglucosamine synthase-like glycosyltransferase